MLWNPPNYLSRRFRQNMIRLKVLSFTIASSPASHAYMYSEINLLTTHAFNVIFYKNIILQEPVDGKNLGDFLWWKSNGTQYDDHGYESSLRNTGSSDGRKSRRYTGRQGTTFMLPTVCIHPTVCFDHSFQIFL